jgi:hypothetical protein
VWASVRARVKSYDSEQINRPTDDRSAMKVTFKRIWFRPYTSLFDTKSTAKRKISSFLVIESH